MKLLPLDIVEDKPQNDINLIINQVLDLISDRITNKILQEIQFLIEKNTEKEKKKQDYLTQEEVCKRLRISRTTLHRRKVKGEIIPDGNNGRPLYSVEQIENYIKNTG